MNSRSVKITLSEKVSKDLEQVAAELGISETEVLRKGLQLMGLYAKIKDQDDSALILRERGKEKDLLIV